MASVAVKIISAIFVIALLGGVGYLAYSEYQKKNNKSGNGGNGGNGSTSVATGNTNVDMLQAGRRTSSKATGYTSDDNVSCHNMNLIGAVQAPYDPKVGTARSSYPSQPMSTKPNALHTSKLSGGLAKRTKVDLGAYTRMSSDRAIGAQGLDLPEDLALASTQLGHLDVREPTRMDVQHPWGETPSSWRVGYIVNENGNIEPGNGIIPTLGPAALAQRSRGMPY